MSMSLLEARTEAIRQKRELEGIGYCEHGHHEVEIDELVTLHKEKICKECRGQFSQCHGGDVIQVGKNGSYVARREENNTGYCDTCGNIQIYSKKSGWQNYE